MSALAGIDQALWDIKGKALGVPIHQLLGGKVRDKIRVYSWVGGDRPLETLAQAREKAARGFTAVKMNACEEMQFVDRYAKVDAAIANVASADGHVTIPDGPGLGIEVNEEYVMEQARIRHRWRNPVWRHKDGSFAEW